MPYIPTMNFDNWNASTIYSKQPGPNSTTLAPRKNKLQSSGGTQMKLLQSNWAQKVSVYLIPIWHFSLP